MRFLVLAVCACSFQHGSAATAVGDVAPPDLGSGSDNNIFPTDASTLARFELNGDVTDSSGNGRDATLIGGTFVATSWGMGLRVPGTATQGMQWTAYASLLAHPYTIEMVVTPDSVSCWKKLFGPADNMDNGWHYCGTFQTYPSNMIGPVLSPGLRDYFALVSKSSTTFDVYENGTLVGSDEPTSFTAPPPEVIFFRDDTTSNRTEALAGVIDAVRISSVSRTQTEITAIATRLAQRP